MKRIDYSGNELRTDGYYYRQVEGKTYRRTIVMFLFKNGIVLEAGSFSTHDLSKVEEKMVGDYKYLYKYKSGWGLFSVDLNAFQYEEWAESPSGASLSTYKYFGYIENDTTIHITESYYSGKNETKQIDEVWHFKQFDNKPDSTNVYIK
ncbi:hypothetical protein AGMMS49965_25660 [Bacteroidia bacterium]|nr:hypothetical protein AGMMS49965_25660 [Bacteroidia bacterium]